MNPKLLQFLKKPAVWIGGAIIAAIIGWFVVMPLDRWTDRQKRQEEAKTEPNFVAVVMSKSDPTFTIPQEFLTGFTGATQLKTRGGDVVRINYYDDNYSTYEANRLARELAANPHCVLVIGSANSQLTAITLSAILASSDRPSMLLPIATASSLTQIASSADYRAMLRMIPDNDNQADQIKNFIIAQKKTPKVAILVDEDNSTYSEDLSKKLSAKIRLSGGEILYEKAYGNACRLMDNPSVLLNKENSPDFIIFVGVSNNGLLLIDELKALKNGIPVIFTDGCTVEELIRRTTSLNCESYFLSAVTITEGQSKPTYEPIGHDALKLAENIISGVFSSSKTEVRRHIENDKSSIVIYGGQAGDYEFDSEGRNKRKSFHIYRRSNGKLTMVTGY